MKPVSLITFSLLFSVGGAMPHAWGAATSLPKKQIAFGAQCIGGALCSDTPEYSMSLPEEGIITSVRVRVNDDVGKTADGLLRLLGVDVDGIVLILKDKIDVRRTGMDLSFPVSPSRMIQRLIFESASGGRGYTDEIQIEEAVVSYIPRYYQAKYSGGCIGGEGCGIGKSLKIPLDPAAISSISFFSHDNIGTSKHGFLDVTLMLGQGESIALMSRFDVSDSGSVTRFSFDPREAEALVFRHSRPDGHEIRREDEIEIQEIEVAYQVY